MAERHPGRLIVNGRCDPRDGDPGLRQLEEDARRVRPQGRQALHRRVERRLARLEARRPDVRSRSSRSASSSGIKNVHVHKGPTIWPLDKDAFDVADVDKVATRYQELNFIVEHVGLPRIEDFCFMATQERNVYAGLAVVVGGLMHARPRFFAKVMGELLFWVGEDKMLFGADYAIWEPKWQVEGLVDWDYPDETFSDYPRVRRPSPRRRSSASTPRGSTASRCPAELRLPERRHARPRRRTRSWSRAPRDRPRARPRRARDGLRPRARRADHVAALRQRPATCRPRATSTSGCGCRRRSARPTSPS